LYFKSLAYQFFIHSNIKELRNRNKFQGSPHWYFETEEICHGQTD